jgi:acetoin utilization deacetylase AcuC-like enzyme
MITIFSAEHTLHAAPHEFLDGRLIPPYEAPKRAAMMLAAIERAAYGPVLPPRAFDDAAIRAVHDLEYLDYLQHAYERWVGAGGEPAAVLPSTLAVRWMGRKSAGPLVAPGYYSFDLSAPIVAGTYHAARAAADVALTGAALLLEGQPYVYALCRPPGHHAGSDLYGGYCYLNNAAIAAEYLVRSTTDHRPPTTAREDKETRRQGDTEMAAYAPVSQSPSLPVSLSAGLPVVSRQLSVVAILDIDFHHGNGTQQIFYARDDVFFASIHADPAREYPYFAGYADERGAEAGLGYNLNIPLEAGVSDERYVGVLEIALEAIAASAARYLIVSAGFDTFGGDPIGDFALTSAAYPAIGRRIAALGLPTLVVQEGGYAVAELGENLTGLLSGMLQ